MELFTKLSRSGYTMLLVSGVPKREMLPLEILANIKQLLTEPLLAIVPEAAFTMLCWGTKVDGQLVLCFLSVGRYDPTVQMTAFGPNGVELEWYEKDLFQEFGLELAPDQRPPDWALEQQFEQMSTVYQLTNQ